MEILKHGLIAKYVATCPLCGCEFSFLETEATLGWSPQELHIRCPECRHTVREANFKKAEK